MGRAVVGLWLLTRAALALEPVPHPVLEGLEPAVVRSIASERQTLEALAADPGAPASVLAAAFGRLGMLYHAYRMTAAAAACYDNALELAPNDLRGLYYRALLDLEEARWAAAAEGFGRFLELAPDDPPALLRHAESLFELGRLEAAREAFGRVLELDAPRHRAAARAGLGRIALAAGEPATAVEHLESALAEQPSATRLHFFLTQAWRRLGERRKAAEHAERYGSAEVAFPEPFVAQLRAVASGVFFHLTAADRAYDAERWELAESLYLEALELDPQSARAHRGIAASAERLGRLVDAERHFAAAVELEPGNASYHHALARVLASRGRREEAQARLEEAVRLDPRLDAAVHELADLRLEAGDALGALAMYEELLTVSPYDRPALLGRASALKAAGRLEAARAELERLVQSDPTDAAARVNLGILHSESGEPSRARAELRTALTLAGEPAVLALARYNLGVLAMETGDLDGARVAVEEALKLDPGLVEARFVLANLEAHAGHYEAALQHYDAVLRADPRHEGARLAAATALVLQGRFGEAKDHLEEGLAALPDSLPIRNTLARVLATSPDEAVRDGDRALELALDVVGAEPTLDHGETLAMAFAEVGAFDRAVELQLRLLEKASEEPRIVRLQANLERYRSGRPASRLRP